jgi:hypothetical protein
MEQTLVGIKDFISRMDYHDFLPKTDEELVSSLNRLLDLSCVEVLVAEEEGKLVGGIGLLYSPGIWDKDVTHVEELFLWVAEGAPPTTLLRILRWTIQRAREKGGKLMTFKSLTSSPKSLDSVYKRLGLRLIENTYMGYC